MSLFSFCLLSFLVTEALGCSCVVSPHSIPRRSAICDGFQYQTDVYTATVKAAYCKCLPGNVTEKFSCIRFWQTEDGDIEGMTQSTYSCNNGETLYFNQCSEVTATVTDQTVDPVTSPITNLSNETNCGFNDDYSQGEGCDLTMQPCYYTITVGEVYKGNYANGQKLNLSGPDVLTSCGQYGRVLEIGEDYLAGIGDGCQPINDWSTVASYSPNEIEIFRLIMNGSRDEVCGSSIVTSSFTIFLFLLLIALLM